MLSAVLTKVIFQKEKKQYELALAEIEIAAKTMVGLDLKLINILGAEDVLSLMKVSDIYAGRCLISAELLNEYGKIFEDQGKILESRNFYLKAFMLYVESLLSNDLPEPAAYFLKTEELEKKLMGFSFSNQFKQRLFEYYDMTGKYSKAEDVLFDLIDSNVDGMRNKGIYFYKRLHDMSDEQLIKGNLSHIEVQESLEELQNLE